MGDHKILGRRPECLKLGEDLGGGPPLPFLVEIAFVDLAAFHTGPRRRDPPDEAMVEGTGADVDRMQIAKRARHDADDIGLIDRRRRQILAGDGRHQQPVVAGMAFQGDHIGASNALSGKPA